MDTRIEIAIEELKSNGWTIQTSDQKAEWWIDEVYELSSIWNSIGIKIYFTIDVDPGANSDRRKGEKIISVSLSKTIPTTRLSNESFTFYLSELDGKGIKRLVTKANEIRNEIITSPNIV
jgi:hypothetical protein